MIDQTTHDHATLQQDFDAADFDPAALERLHQAGGADLVRQIVDFVLRSTPHRLATLTAGIAAHDPESCEKAAHSLQSSAGNVGAHAVQRLAAQVERTAESARRGDPAAMTALIKQIEDLDTAWRRVRGRLALHGTPAADGAAQ